MSYDYFKHIARDRWRGEPAWDGERFSLRLARAMGGRVSVVPMAGSWGLMLTIPSVMFLFEGGGLHERGAPVLVPMLAIGVGLLYWTARVLAGRLHVVGDARHLRVWRGPLPPTGRRHLEVAEIERVAAAVRPFTFAQRHLGKRAPEPTYQPWTVELWLRGGELLRLPAHLRVAEAETLASALTHALGDAKLRAAERRGFRG